MNIHLPRLIMEEFENLRPNQIFWSDCLKERPSGEKVLLRHEQPQIDVNVVDGAGMVQMNAPKTVTTFREYNKVEIGDKVNSLIACGQQLDVYEKWSCKTETWEGHGKKDGVRTSIKENTTIYRKFAKVLKPNDNKTELFKLTADALSGIFKNQQNVLLITQ